MVRDGRTCWYADTALNPFVYSHPVEPEQLVDREADAVKLVELAEGGHATRLSAPRRWGKTSLLYKVKADAEAAGMACVYVDLTRAVGLADVAVTVEEAYRRGLQGAPRRAAVALIRAMNPRATATPGGIGVEVTPGVDPDLVRRFGDLLDIPVGLHKRTGTRTLVIFDEFQELLQAADQLDALVRARTQHHGAAASYIYAGSHPGLMRELFANRERPLFGQAQPLHLQPLTDPDLADYIGERFAQTGREPGEALEPILDIVEGHPQRAMMLAHHLWARTPPGATASAEGFGDALDAVRAEAKDALQATWNKLSHAERSVLAALAGGEAPLLSERSLRRFGIAKTTAREARDRLVADGLLVEVDDRIAFADPLLTDFAANRHGESR